MQIDMNSDVGESFGVYKLGLDEKVIPHITSANIACGFHAGDPGVMRKTVALAKQYDVGVGAHPGFPDLLGFGRRKVDATLEEIQDYVLYQTGALMAFAQSQGLKLQHVKAHGSLYNMAVANPKIWEAMAEALAKVDRDIILVVLASSKRESLLDIGKRHSIRIAFEAFPDRAYNKDGSLVSRRERGAVIHDHEIVAKRGLKMALEGRVIALDGTKIELKADTLCVHGDNPAAVEMVKRIRQELKDAGVAVTPMKNFI
ncbi:MAG: lactam utilization protein LamB [Deltaproteobacteria bacterium RBG_16_47_11]|nr:MAG: lactam utilization protein LamB [Deltaproteobacteria bacterium RBG_16_47_11]